MWNRPLLTRDLLAIAKFRFTIKLVELHICVDRLINILDYKGNYSAKSNNSKLVHWPLIGRLLRSVQRGWAWAGCGPAQSPHHFTKCNSPPSTASVPITVLLYDGPLLYSFNVAIKGLAVVAKVIEYM